MKLTISRGKCAAGYEPVCLIDSAWCVRVSLSMVAMWTGIAPYVWSASPVVESVTFQVSDVTGVGVDDQQTGSGQYDGFGVVRRDPSDVIKINEQFYVFYTKVVKYPDGENGDKVPLWPQGWPGTVWYATSADGMNWNERGEALGKGAAGAWDSFGVYTPNIIRGTDDEYYLYYTGVQDGFENNNTTDITNIGVAKLTLDSSELVSDAVRLNRGAPILSPTFCELDSGCTPKFDSFRIDDSSLLLRDYDGDGTLEYGLYYKGRAQQGGAGQTKMGLAISKSAAGPFVRQNDGDPVQPEGHEVLVWAQGSGVMSLASGMAGKGLWYAEDGIHFTELTEEFTGSLLAPGAFRPELTDPDYTDGIQWGISMLNTPQPYLAHYSFDPTLLASYADLNEDGLANATDWQMYRAGFGANLTGLTVDEARRMGDVNGDFRNDESDFALFKLAYDEVNGAGAFSALQASVPEPATLTILFTGAFVHWACHRLGGIGRLSIDRGSGKVER
jgi:hypothetical protein